MCVFSEAAGRAPSVRYIQGEAEHHFLPPDLEMLSNAGNQILRGIEFSTYLYSASFLATNEYIIWGEQMSAILCHESLFCPILYVSLFCFTFITFLFFFFILLSFFSSCLFFHFFFVFIFLFFCCPPSFSLLSSFFPATEPLMLF